MSNLVHLHLHSMDSNPYSGLEVDSITPFGAYIKKAKECGMKAIAFTEHGSVLHNVEKKQMCEKHGIKYIHAEEFYVTEEINTEKLVRDNYHCCLYAKNKEGVRELNYLSSKSFNREDGHFYYNPRITMDELESTSDNILVLTACTGGILCKGTPTIQERFLKFLIANKHRCWLEIQPHNFDMQVKYNQYLYTLATKYNMKLIATTDVHAINKDHMDGRAIMQKGKGVVFHDEDDCDLTFKTYDEMIAAFEKQFALPKGIYTKAIQETEVFADLIEDYALDYSHKYPRFKNAEQEFLKRISDGVKERGINKLPNYKTEYVPRIKEEFDTYKHNDAIDFMLLDSDYKTWMSKNGMHCGVSRGSVSGSLIAYLLHNTDVDSVKYKLNFQRFMNTERVSLADIDTDIYADDRYKVREYLFQRDDLYCCNIITFNTIQMKAAIKDIGRAFGMTPDETQALSDMVEQDEKKRDYIPEEIRNQHSEMFRYVDMVIGTITSLGRHAAGIVCSPVDITYEFGTCSIASDPRPVSQIDMHEIDSLNFVKMDLLGLNAVGLIYKACQLANIDYRTPDNTDFNDENVIKSIAKDTTLIFQFESGFASEALRTTLSESTLKNIREKNKDASYLDIMAMVSGAIRPAGASYREQLFNGIYRDNGNEVLNDFLASTLGFLVYQEQIIDFLFEFCGFTMGQSDTVRRHFAKKTGTEADIPIIENGGYMIDSKGNKDERYIKGFTQTVKEKYNIPENEAKEIIKYFLKVIEDASDYLFSRNHAIPYSMIGYFIGWLRYYYTLELLTAALIVYVDNSEKMASIKEYVKSKGIEIKPIQFGKSRADFFMDKKENVIYQGIASIKYCNAKIAEDLYELAQNSKYDNFIDLLVDIKTNRLVDTRQLTILTGLSFFKEFGKNKYLLEVIEWYDKIGSVKIIKKNKIESLGLTEDIVREYAGKETEKQFSQIDNIGLLKAVIQNIEDKPLSIREQIRFEKDYLEYIVYTNPKAPKEMYYVAEFKTYKNKYKPYVQLYNLRTGEMIKSKVTSEKKFIESPFKEDSVLHVKKFTSKNKTKMVNGEWTKTNEMEQILTEWDVY